MLGRRGGLTSTISVHSRPSASMSDRVAVSVSVYDASAMADDVLRISRAAETMSPSWRSISSQPRVFSPQSGLTHRSASSMKPRK